MRGDVSKPAFTRIVLIIGNLTTAASGPNVMVRRLAAWLVNQGHHVTVVGTWRGRRPSPEELRRQYGRARVVLHRRYLKDTWHFVPGVIALTARFMFSRQPCIIDVHSVWLFNGLVLSLVARLRKWSYFVTLHGNLRPVPLAKNKYVKAVALKLLFGWWLRGATALVALNEREKADAHRILPNATIKVIGAGIVPHPSPLSASRNRVVLFLGRIEPIKNLESLIDAFGQVCDEFPDWTLAIVGPAADPDYKKQLRTRCLDLHLEDRVLFHDAVYGKEKERCFLSASLFALTSWSEGQPFAVLEAMAHGLPVIISDQCNISVPENCGRVCGCSVDKISLALREMFSLSEVQIEVMRYEVINLVGEQLSEDEQFRRRLALYFGEAPEEARI